MPSDQICDSCSIYQHLPTLCRDMDMNATTNHSLTVSNAVSCGWTFDDQFADKLFSVLSIILNLLTCPLTVLLNTMVIIAVKTRPRLHNVHNLILASMAGTDLAVGMTAQPMFIAREISRQTGGSISMYCNLSTITLITSTLLCITSLFHLTLISVERLIAMKYSLRYNDIATKRRLTAAIAMCWLFAAINVTISLTVARITAFFAIIITLVIFYCHVSVYFVCRRHLHQMKSEQNSSEATTKFLEDRKAWKTTSIILGGLLLSYLPQLLSSIARRQFSILLLNSVEPLAISFVMLNSILNPVIYCWRSRVICHALLQLLGKKINNVWKKKMK